MSLEGLQRMLSELNLPSATAAAAPAEGNSGRGAPGATTLAQMKTHLNKVIRAHNQHVDESKQIWTALQGVERTSRQHHDELETLLQTFIREHDSTVDVLTRRVTKLEEYLHQLAQDLTKALQTTRATTASASAL